MFLFFFFFFLFPLWLSLRESFARTARRIFASQPRGQEAEAEAFGAMTISARRSFDPFRNPIGKFDGLPSFRPN